MVKIPREHAHDGKHDVEHGKTTVLCFLEHFRNDETHGISAYSGETKAGLGRVALWSSSRAHSIAS